MKKTTMMQEVQQQPAALEKLLRLERKNVEKIGTAIKERGGRFMVFAARGSSDNAAVYGKYLLEYRNAIACELAAPSIFTVYGRRVNLKESTVLGISQSGEGTDIIETLARAKESGAFTVAVTNTAKSSITAVADAVIHLRAGKERGLAATKTYTCQLMAMMMLSAALRGEKRFWDGLARIPGRMEKLLSLEEPIAELAERYRYMQHCVIIGRGFNYATVKEAALKMMETCYLVAQPFSTADFQHGPIAMAEEGFPVFLCAADGKMAPALLKMARGLKKRGVETVAVSSRPDILELSQKAIRMPFSPPEITSPIFYIVPFQIFSNYCALAKGIDPDSPRYLKKITRTF